MSKFTKRSAWTGQACLALLCAFSAIGGSAYGGLVGRLTSAVLATNPDSAGMTLEQYEQMFGLDLTNPSDAFAGYDQDGLSNLAEWYNGTNPFRTDSDDDGWPDGIDNEISRARLDFHPLFTDGDFFRYIWPSWMVAAFKAGGAEWETSLPAWSLAAGSDGKLCLIVDRSVLTDDVVLELEFYDAPDAALFVDLVNINNEALISSEIVGNPSTLLRAGLVDGSGQIVRKAINIPLENFPEAVGIHIRATGEFFLLEGLLFVDRENDGLDTSQEAMLGTSDLMLDSDGDGISDYDEVFVYGTNPAVPDRSSANSTSSGDEDVSIRPSATVSYGRAQQPVAPFFRPTDGQAVRPYLPAFSAANPQPFQATQITAITIPQWVQARLAGAQSWMSGANFIMSRNTLDGGGTRQTSPAFIMEDSFAQSSAIGFSFGSNITLHAGYQQADAERLELWNVSVTPPPPPDPPPQRHFNPTLGETSVFSYVLSTSARAVTVNVYEQQGGALVRILVAQQPQSGGLHTVAWDGRDTNGFAVPDQRYRFGLSATSYEGTVTNYQAANPNEIRIDVDSTIPVIKAVSDQPEPFFPDTAITSTISYVTAAPAGVNNMNLTIEIYADNLSPIRTWATNQPIGANSVVWDGTDNNSLPLPDGLYTYAINHDENSPPNRANRQTGASMLLRANTQAVTSADSQVVVRYSGPSIISITSASPVEASDALFAIKTAAPGQMLQSAIYRIEAAPPTTFVPPALMAFKYDQAISGDIEQKLQIRRYNATNRVWEIVPIQFIDYANHQVLAEITSFSLYALLWGEDTTPPVIQIISPEAREYYQNATIDIIYEVEDPVVGGISSGVTEVFVYLNGELYPYSTIPPSTFMLGENVLTVVAYDGAGNIGRATVYFTIILEAQVTLKPEALNVNPGILTAFVRLPEGYPVSGITSATCDGAFSERMTLSTAGGSASGGNDDATEMIIKFRRQDIEDALAQIGESIDTDFIVRGAWQDDAGNSYVFQGADSITKIVGAK